MRLTLVPLDKMMSKEVSIGYFARPQIFLNTLVLQQVYAVLTFWNNSFQHLALSNAYLN